MYWIITLSIRATWHNNLFINYKIISQNFFFNWLDIIHPEMLETIPPPKNSRTLNKKVPLCLRVRRVSSKNLSQAIGSSIFDETRYWSIIILKSGTIMCRVPPFLRTRLKSPKIISASVGYTCSKKWEQRIWSTELLLNLKGFLQSCFTIVAFFEALT